MRVFTAQALRSRRGSRTLVAFARGTLALTVATLVAPVLPAGAGIVGELRRVSLGWDDAQAHGPSLFASVDGSGTLVAFRSEASTLVPGDSNGAPDVFVRYAYSGETTCVSVDATGVPAGGSSGSPAVSGDGGSVAFESQAADIVQGDTNGTWDVFVRDLASGTTTRASVGAGGSQGDGDSRYPDIDHDGERVVFVSASTTLVAGDGNGVDDIFLRDLTTQETTRVSTAADGSEAGARSLSAAVDAAGRFVAFASEAADLHPSDTDGLSDVFVKDTLTGDLELVSVSSSGAKGNLGSSAPAISADGRYVAFESLATNLVTGDGNGIRDVFVHDRTSGATVRVSVSSAGAEALSGCQSPSLSADGRYVAFDSAASLVSGDLNGVSDIFVRDTVDGTTARVSVDASGTEATGPSFSAALTASGLGVAFHSYAEDLDPGDTNGVADMFYVGTLERTYVRVAGSTRFATAVEASRRGFPTTATAVVIATARNWPDALGGSALAGAVGGPMLLVDTHSVPASVTAEIARLAPSKAYVLGGTAALGDEVFDALESQLGLGAVERIAGASRYDTAQEVASATIAMAPSWDGLGYVATGANYPDALAVSPVAYAKTRPVVLARPGPTPPALPAGTTDARVLGGTKAVSAEVETALRGTLGSGNVERIAGTTRYDTAALIADHGVAAGLGWDGVSFATGESFPDALSGGAMTGEIGAVMLLTRSLLLPDAPRQRLEGNAQDILKVHLLGGTGALSGAVADEIRAALEG